MEKIILNIVIFLFFVGCFFIPQGALAHQPRLIYSQNGDIQIKNPEISQAFYDELKGAPRDYFIDSATDFNFYINLLVPAEVNGDGRYSANVFLIKDGAEEKVVSIDGSTSDWAEYYEEFGRDWYLKGPELSQQLLAGKYKIEVFSKDNLGKYVLAVGEKEVFDVPTTLNVYWQLPLLKMEFFKTSVLQFFLTPFGIWGIAAVGALLIFVVLIYYLIGVMRAYVVHSQAKTLLLTSGGMPQMKDEIIKLLQKPAYDVTVAFITTAAKPLEDKDFLQRDWITMKEELGFNVEEVDIEGKREGELTRLLEIKDIIFVEGGNAFYLLKAMRACNFEKILRRLLKVGKVYIGASAGSIVAGKTVKTAGWLGDKNNVRLKNLKGLNLVPFDIFVHYTPEWAEIIKAEIKNPKKRAENLKIITDDQGILVQGNEVNLIGDGEAVVL